MVIRLVYKMWFMPRADHLQGVKTVVCYLIDWIKTLRWSPVVIVLMWNIEKLHTKNLGKEKIEMHNYLVGLELL